MKTYTLTTFLLGAFMIIVKSTHAQDTLTLQPDAVNGKDAIIWRLTSPNTAYGDVNNSNYGNVPDMQAMEWTWHSVEGTRNTLFDFDLSTLPYHNNIVKANLYLYGNPSSVDLGFNTGDKSNIAVLKRITGMWNEDSVTWNTRPAVTSINQISLLPTTATVANLKIDVTLLIKDMLADSANSHGFMISMLDSIHYRKLIFASSDHTNPSLHPKLEVIYFNTTAIEEFSNNIKVFPNPVTNGFTLLLEEWHDKKIQLIDMDGKKIMEIMELKNRETHIERGNTPAGSYILRILKDDVPIKSIPLIVR